MKIGAVPDKVGAGKPAPLSFAHAFTQRGVIVR
jgi:hypothetical protein